GHVPVAGQPLPRERTQAVPSEVVRKLAKVDTVARLEGTTAARAPLPGLVVVLHAERHDVRPAATASAHSSRILVRRHGSASAAVLREPRLAPARARERTDHRRVLAIGAA